ncbi:alpha-L-rhamnosidase C-terminal domain-containing protein [Flavicella sp.]|uniref:alpha-L-rhamnosidase-related protein n=1 Tax=Flavicella sp. TaxID=2957742 RepID=UPI0030199118
MKSIRLKQFNVSYKLIVCFIWSCLLLVVGCKSKYSNSINERFPLGLSIEFIRQPEDVLIVDSKPKFAWEVPTDIVEQSAYQILVASSTKNCNDTSVDVWNSNKVLNSQSINIEFNGKPLEVGKTYFWKVKIWDKKDHSSSYSKIQSFTLGKKANGITTANKFQIEKIKPIRFIQKEDNSYFIDFGKAAFSSLQFHYKAITNDTLIVHIGEQLTNNTINKKPKGSIRYQKIKVPVYPDIQVYNLKIKPNKRNTKPVAIALQDSFPVLLPFRYVEIENAKGDLELQDFTQIAYFSYWEDDSSYFNSSDSILNKVWDLCKYSIKATTFAGLYVDGDRERIPYEADAYLNQLSHYTTDREYAIARQTIEYFMENPTWPTEWQLHVALMFYADYMYTGNTELIDKYYEELKNKTLYELRREDGLISSTKATPEFMKKLGFNSPKTKLKDIVDWPPAQKDTGWKLATEEGERDGFVFKPINTVVNCFYYKNLLIMMEFSEVLGKAEDFRFFKDLSTQVKISINTKLFDSQRGVYVDGEGTMHASLHSNMLALAFDIVPEKYMKSVVEFVKSRGMACSVYGAQYLLEAMFKANESQYALELLTAKHDRSWYNMIKIGSTMTLEAWDIKYKPNLDWNHAWGAAPANIIPRYLWGIQPKTPGYSIALIKPLLGDLTSSSIVVPTLKGKIKGAYIVQGNDSVEYTIEIPANIKAEFDIKDLFKAEIIHNGKIITNKLSHIILISGKHTITIVLK